MEKRKKENPVVQWPAICPDFLAASLWTKKCPGLEGSIQTANSTTKVQTWTLFPALTS